MSPPGLSHYLVIGALLFVIGMIGFLTRRNMILMFLNAELMIQGVAINFVAFARHRGNLEGQGFFLFLLAVAACEAALALALILVLYKVNNSLDISIWQNLREDDMDPIVDEEPLPAALPPETAPKLSVAGTEPAQEEELSHV
jgi:NADH-quinone oxidoreductase subunit K